MKRLGASFLLALFAASANGQSMSFPPMMTVNFSGQGDAQGNMGGTLTVSGRLPIAPALLGAPFSGEESRKQEQVLADGTHISRPSPLGAKVARDAQGRTRVERPLMQRLNMAGRSAQEPLMIVEINDPVDGYYYVLDPTKKIAHRVKYRPVPARTVPPVQPNPPQGGIQVAGALIPGGNPDQRLQVTREQLGLKFIQGVQADGVRMTTLIPVGAQGNDRPITQVSETWRAPGLELTILQTTKSPLGDSTFEISNLSTVTPTPDLFRPPPGYEVREEPATFTTEFGNRTTGAATSSFSINGGAVVGGVTAPPAGTQR